MHLRSNKERIFYEKTDILDLTIALPEFLCGSSDIVKHNLFLFILFMYLNNNIEAFTNKFVALQDAVNNEYY